LVDNEQNETKRRIHYHKNPKNEGVPKPFEAAEKGFNGYNKGFEGVFSKLRI